jgi:hypothetical protein
MNISGAILDVFFGRGAFCTKTYFGSEESGLVFRRCSLVRSYENCKPTSKFHENSYIIFVISFYAPCMSDIICLQFELRWPFPKHWTLKTCLWRKTPYSTKNRLGQAKIQEFCRKLMERIVGSLEQSN